MGICICGSTSVTQNWLPQTLGKNESRGANQEHSNTNNLRNWWSHKSECLLLEDCCLLLTSARSCCWAWRCQLSHRRFLVVDLGWRGCGFWWWGVSGAKGRDRKGRKKMHDEVSAQVSCVLVSWIAASTWGVRTIRTKCIVITSIKDYHRMEAILELGTEWACKLVGGTTENNSNEQRRDNDTSLSPHGKTLPRHEPVPQDLDFAIAKWKERTRALTCVDPQLRPHETW